jgi:hypothetical protein
MTVRIAQYSMRQAQPRHPGERDRYLIAAAASGCGTEIVNVVTNALEGAGTSIGRIMVQIT